MQRIYLLGFMGSGKSYLGQKLAQELGWSFCDLDDEIESKEQSSIRQIFETKGEGYFRKLEQDCLFETKKKSNVVIALGGGTPCFYDNMLWVVNNGCSVFLDLPVEVLMQRLLEETEKRPLLQGKSEQELKQFISKKLEERRPYYSQANYTIKTANQAINKIKTVMKKNPLLLLHGALGSKAQLIPFVENLATDFDVRMLNLRGHGGQAYGEEPFSMDLFVEDVLDYMAENNLEQVDVFGYSMGGYVALNLARLHPEKIGKIFTLATKFAWSVETSAKEVKMLNPELIEAKVPAFAKQLKERHAPQDWKEHLEKTAEMMLALGDGAALSIENFSSIEHQVMVTVGAKDKMVSKEESQEIAAALPNGKFELLADFPHPIEKVDVALLCEKIRHFIN